MDDDGPFARYSQSDGSNKFEELTCSGWQCVMTGADNFIDTGKTRKTKTGYTLHYLKCTKCGQKDWYLYLSQPRLKKNSVNE